MKQSIFILTCLLSATLCFATTFSSLVNSCPAPQNVTKTAETSNSLSFDWDDCCGALQSFQVYYVKDGNTSATYQTNSSDITFTNLETGDYEFHFFTDCGGVQSADVIIVEDVMNI